MSSEYSIEKAFLELEEIIHKLENEDISFEESVLLYENGMETYKKCQDYLKTMEGKIKKLSDENSDIWEDFGEE
ncbi:MAG: exodeoxyribonuclease VII small subunit [Tissierellia bacterium]|nr:exodeoxyribonuclease VII small subunit [Tissierellia bacterium]